MGQTEQKLTTQMQMLYFGMEKPPKMPRIRKKFKNSFKYLFKIKKIN